MIFGILSSLCAALGDVYYKKALKISNRYISDSVYQFIGYGFLTLCLLVLVYAVEGGIGKVSAGLIGLFFLSSGFNVIVEYLEQYSFRNEKMSVLAPYSEAHTLFASVIAFIYFSNSSLIAFLSAVIGTGVLIIGSIDFKKFKINRYCIALILGGVLTAVRIIIFGVVLETINPISSVFLSLATALVIIIFVMLLRRESAQVLKSPLKLNKLIFAEGAFWILGVTITLFLIKSEGVVLAVLASMTYLGVAPLISYYFFGEKPKMKEIYIILIVLSCVAVGSFFG